MPKHNIKKSAALLMTAVLIEKILGFVRDMAIASHFGATGLTDSYIGGFLIPNFIMVLLSAGFVNAYVPMFMSEMEIDEDGAWKKISSISTYLLLFLIVITVLGIVFSKDIVGILYPGFSENSLNAASSISRIFFIAVLIYSVGIIESSLLNCFRHFIYSPVSIGFLSAGTIIWIILFGKNTGINSIAYGYLAGALIGVILQYAKLKMINAKLGINFIVYKNFTSKFFNMLFPLLVATSMSQVNVFVDRIFASYLPEGSMSYLSYADRVTQLPIVFFSGVISTIIFPDLIQYINNKDNEQFKIYFNRAALITLLFLIPSFAGIMVLNREIVELLFERNAFDSLATLKTASALVFYSPTIILYGGMAIISKVYYSIKDASTLMYISIISIILNVILDYVLMNQMGHNGLALATSIVAIFQLAAAYLILKKKVDISLGNYIVRNLAKVCAASAIMVLAIILVKPYIYGLPLILLVMILIVLGIVIYFGLLTMLKVDGIELLKNKFSKKNF